MTALNSPTSFSKSERYYLDSKFSKNRHHSRIYISFTPGSFNLKILSETTVKNVPWNVRVASLYPCFISNLKVPVAASRLSFLNNSKIFHWVIAKCCKEHEQSNTSRNLCFAILLQLLLSVLSAVIKNRHIFKIKNKYSFN